MSTVGSQFVAMSQALGVMSTAWPYRVTFKKSTVTKGSSGGNVTPAPAAIASDIPCLYRPAKYHEIQLAGKAVSGAIYSIFVPAQYNESLVQVDGKCSATIAATTGGDTERTFNVIAPMRHMGLKVLVLCSIEE